MSNFQENHKNNTQDTTKPSQLGTWGSLEPNYLKLALFNIIAG